jgi:molybdenum-dependent DNA-binding transcriptional regulator ModE
VLLVEEINNGLHEPAVTAATGVRGAVVTAVGARIIDLYHSIESQAISVADTEFRALGALARRETSVSMTGSR